ncbi:MAG TPA: 3-dehydroquinate synthase [Bacteroidales bacterium]|nr:3-dehydroquinate synthase [Bacteroidales bacterium]
MRIETSFSTIIISTTVQSVIKRFLDESDYSKVFILVDENTKKHCLPHIQTNHLLDNAKIIEIRSGELNKSIETIINIWTFLTRHHADRNSVLINLGGGIIGDMGGFAASTFKRGIDFVNIPTTLLSQVDASAGGKTGINFLALKNEIGVFSHPKNVFIDSHFLKTLDKRNILSGWAEMIKHTLIFNQQDFEHLIQHNITTINFNTLNQLIARSVQIKNHYVESDPQEKGMRKALNFGHTFGHAFESFFMDKKSRLLHGEAVALGMLCEIYLSSRLCNFPANKMTQIVRYILNIFSKPNIPEKNKETILELIGHDKKNKGTVLHFTLLEDFGKIKINQHCSKNQMLETLKWYNTL